MATFEENLERARVALHNALNDEQLLSTLSPYGYGIERLQEGLALYENARLLMQSQSDVSFSKANIFKNFQESWKMAKFQYQRDADIARFVFGKDEASLNFLQLKAADNRNFDRWRDQARSFYTGLQNHPDLLAALAPIGLTAERIEQGIRNLQTLEETRLTTHVHRGSEADTRAQRRVAFEALNRWMVNFRTIARVAFASQPALLAKLAINSDWRKPKKKKDGFAIPPIPLQRLETVSP